jgi:sulfite reductase (ferredoxin)
MSTGTTMAVKETKAQRAERLKLEKNPWECFEEIRQFASKGLAAVPDAWIKTYFRWWGVYTQGDGAGAVGGVGGEGRATPYFMLRIRLSNGFVNAAQVRAIALRCAKTYNCTGSRSKIFQMCCKLFLIAA